MNELIGGRSGVARATVTSWRYEWDGCPRGAKMLLLTEGGIAIIGHISDSTKGYIAWAPLPDRDREKEAEIARKQGKEFL